MATMTPEETARDMAEAKNAAGNVIPPCEMAREIYEALDE